VLSNIRKTIIVLGALGAIAIGASAVAGAASSSGTTGSQGVRGTAPQGQAPDAMRHGPGETLLTDGTADEVKQAALDKVPGATVIRVETDSEGSPYEAHLRKSDGSEVTVKMNKQFEATAVDSGFGAGGPPPGAWR
jgi:hypothetical protein